MFSTAHATNNSATPPALLQYIPDHLLDERKRDYYTCKHTLCEIQVRDVELGIERIRAIAGDAQMIRVNTNATVYLSAKSARAVALAMLQLADTLEELAQQGGAA